MPAPAELIAAGFATRPAALQDGSSALSIHPAVPGPCPPALHDALPVLRNEPSPPQVDPADLHLDPAALHRHPSPLHDDLTVLRNVPSAPHLDPAAPGVGAAGLQAHLTCHDGVLTCYDGMPSTLRRNTTSRTGKQSIEIMSTC